MDSLENLPLTGVGWSLYTKLSLIIACILYIISVYHGGLLESSAYLFVITTWVGGSVLIANMAIGAAVYTNSKRVKAETDWETTPFYWGLASAVLPMIGLAAYSYRRSGELSRARRDRFRMICDEFDQTLQTLQADAAPYLETESYLDQHNHKELASTYQNTSAKLGELKRAVEQSKELSVDHDRITQFEQELEEIEDILAHRDSYNKQFVEVELQRRQSFFSNVGKANYDLNLYQRKAIIRNEVNNRVIAGAGTGKTLALTARVAYLVKYQDVAPEDILVVTFLNEAAEEMERRLRTDFGITGIEASTLHSVGYSIISESEQRYPEVIDDNDLKNFIKAILNRENTTVPETFYDHFANFMLHDGIPTIQKEDFGTKRDFVDRLKRQNYRTLRDEMVKSRAEKLIADFLHTHDIEYRYEARADLNFENSENQQNLIQETNEISDYAIEDTPTSDSHEQVLDARTNSDCDKEIQKPNQEVDLDVDDDKEFEEYRPDFYLPDEGVYIEHYGINEQGEVAEWFSQSSEEYIEKIHWARSQFDQADATLIQTYQFEFSTGRLRQALTHRLQHHGVTVERLPYETLVEKTYQLHEEDLPIQRSFKRFIRVARTFGIDPTEIPQRLSSDRPRQYYFGLCGGLLLDRYETLLQETGNIDFSDMIFDGISKVTESRSSVDAEYEHVLVDEFQDINRAQMEFVESLTEPDGTHLFAVGDDWQSIYSFQGAIVDLFIDFERRLAPATTTTLNVNYRSPDQLVKASNELIEQNESQLEKDAIAASDAPAAVAKYLLGGYQEYDYIDYTAELAAHLVEEYLESGCDPEDIMILCRYDSAVTYLDAVRLRLQNRSIPHGISDEDEGVSVCSVHKAKGRQAKHVIVTHASEGGMGFPATERDSELLDPIRDIEMNTLAEERRLFYVAITRSSKTLDVITKKNDQSRFIEEIEEYVDTVTEAEHIVGLEPGEGRAFLQAKASLLFDDVHLKKHQGGILEDNTDSIRFVSWASNDPPTLEPDSWYRFENIKIGEYKGDPQVVLTDLTKATKIDPEKARIEVETIHENLSEAVETDSSNG